MKKRIIGVCTSLLITLSIFSQTYKIKIPEAVLLGKGVVGALYQPQQENPHSQIAILVMHAEEDYTQFSAGEELATRGFTVLCANNSASKTGAANDIDFERAMNDISKCIRYLRERNDIRKIILLGHSGGGAMFSAYQNIAENGLAACQGYEKIVPCSNEMANLPVADGIILLDANYGLSTMFLLSLDPAVTDETNGLKTDENLDLLSSENGMTPNGAHYSNEFRKKYQTATAVRMNKLINNTLKRKKDIEEGNGFFSDDEPMTIPGANYTGNNNKLFSQDPSLLSHTTHAWNLLHKDGSITNEVIYTVRKPRNMQPTTNLYSMALKTTVNRFLKTFAIRVDDNFSFGEDGFLGVQWDSTHTSPISAVKGISVPLLTLGMTGNWEYLAAEKIYLNAKSKDKSIAFIEGASHGITPNKDSEKFPGQFGDTVKTTYDYIAKWLLCSERF